MIFIDMYQGVKFPDDHDGPSAGVGEKVDILLTSTSHQHAPRRASGGPAVPAPGGPVGPEALSGRIGPTLSNTLACHL